LNMAFSRHATSKIKDKDDLNNIDTLGFRGEALPSIASVSRISIKTSNGIEAYMMVLDAGKILNNEKTATNQGTDIKIKNLFYNTTKRVLQERLKKNKTL